MEVQKMTIKNRNQVDPNTTWNLKDLYESDDSFYQNLESLQTEVVALSDKYKGTITDADTVVSVLNEYKDIQEKLVRLSTYASLNTSEDQGNPENMKRSGTLQMKFSQIVPQLNFITQEINRLNKDILKEAQDKDESLRVTLDHTLREMDHILNPEVEDAISKLSGTLNAPYEVYNMNKLVDMKFKPITVDGQEIPFSFGYYEDELAYSTHTEVRHKAYDSFHNALKDNQNTHAGLYKAHILKEKTMGQLKGFDSTIDYLLFNQEVSRDMYDRQIDLITKHLAKPMQKFAKHLQHIHKLDKMTYKDLSLVVDPTFEPDISIDEAKAQLKDGLQILGDDYLEMIEKAFDDKWIDFPSNQGKSTGAFASSPYGVHPYILISWTHKMREVFVLAHELGHAGHFYFAGQNQNIYNTRPSLYFIEAPSTMNELLMANHLKQTADNPRLKRWILSTIISRTYYHNFVTHLIEAAYQREVYETIDRNEPISASVLNGIFKKVLTDFWGDAVEISENAELTWMRQPHYYMGLYPYTYSAGLTLATEASQKILHQEIDIDQWKDVLKAGGTKTPLELAKMVDVDLSTDKPLMNTIKHIESMIDEIIELTAIIEAQDQ